MQSIAGTNVRVLDEVGGLATEAVFSGGTPATTADVFAPGCRLINTNSGVIYRNVGTSAAPVWDADTEMTNPQETITASGALSTVGTTTLDSSGGALTCSIGSADTPGTIKVIVMQDATASSTVSITNHVTSDPEVATFDAVDETLVLVWTGTEWATLYATATFV